MVQDQASRRSVLTAVGGTLGLSVAGCLGDRARAAEGELSGRIVASGSNTVAPITQIAAEDFEADHRHVTVVVDPQGTGAGFSVFCQAASAVQSASREIYDPEARRCDEHGVSYSRYTVGQDGLAIGVHASNDWCRTITLEELRRMWVFQATDEITHWRDVRDDWPDRRMQLHARDSASGTFDYFTEAITGEVGNVRDDYSATSQTDEIWRAVGENPYAFGWGGVGHFRAQQEAGAALRAVKVESDEDGEFYPPEREYIESGRYSPLARPLYFYLNHAMLGDEPDLIGSFARFFINNQHNLAEEVGFYRTADDVLVANHDRLDRALESVGVDPDALSVDRRDP